VSNNGKLIDVREEEIQSSIQDVQDFLASRAWEDVKMIVNNRIFIIMQELAVETDDREYRFKQGEIRGLRDYLQVPDRILEELLQREEDESKGEDITTKED